MKAGLGQQLASEYPLQDEMVPEATLNVQRPRAFRRHASLTQGKAYVDLKESLDGARQWLSDKIAP
jgi:hypothetical protein